MFSRASVCSTLGRQTPPPPPGGQTPPPPSRKQTPQGRPPPPTRRADPPPPAVNEWVVPILLECILSYNILNSILHFEHFCHLFPGFGILASGILVLCSFLLHWYL